MKGIRAEAVVVGTGAGGAMVARELVRAGKDVVIVEQGPDMSRFAGMKELELGRALYQENGKYPKTREGYSLLRGINMGGSTVLAAGHGVRCLEDKFGGLGIDLEETFRETETELGLRPMPDRHIGPNAALLNRSAKALKLSVTRWDKFIDFDRCTHCGQCTLTCPMGAKWSSSRVMDKLRLMDNVRVLTGTKVMAVVVSGGRAIGVSCETAAGPIEISADLTILCAGGLGTPVILQNSGISSGSHLFLDVFRIVYGRSTNFTAAAEPCMSTVIEEHSGRGYILFPYADAALMFEGVKGWFGDRPPYGIMVKAKDDHIGTIDRNGRVSKFLTDEDRRRLSHGEALAGKILQQAGAPISALTVSEPAGGHPGGTAAIGEVVNPDLECKSVGNLYVCDASVFPESPGRPPIVTICALGKWLGKRLANE
ncbi:MAG: FAD-dependent oxidoreductase [Desulfobacterales bacterium]|nr:FAD-dependent oxidoreductase [Desulfobacterales bacterium]